MKIKTYLLIALVSFVVYNNISAQGQELLFCSEYFNINQRDFVEKNKLKNVYVIYQDKIVDSKTDQFTKEEFIESINNTIPNKNESGFGVIDLENIDYQIITNKSKLSKPKYGVSLNKFIEILNVAQKVRPNIKWSFFGIIPGYYTEVSRNEYSNNMSMMLPLLKKIDFFAIDIYYTDKWKVDSKRTMFNYIETNVSRAIELSKELDKPVLPFVWHRYSLVSNAKSQQKLNRKLFKEYVKKILEVESNGKKVDGIIWWNAESYAWSNRNENGNLKKEFRRVKWPMEYQLNLLQKYLDAIKPLF